MGQPNYIKNSVRKLCLSDEQIEALQENDEAKWLTLAIYQGFLKCGNCGKRMKCATDLVGEVKRQTDIDVLLSEMGDLDGMSNTKIAEVGMTIFDFLDEHLDEGEKYELAGELMGEFNIDPVDLINSFDKLFENCREYNLDDKL